MTSIHAWSTTAADNASIDPSINWQENQNPDTVNNSARQMMARQAEYLRDTHVSRVSTGSANQYVVTGASAPGGWVDGLRFAFRAHQANGGAAQVNFNGQGFKPLRRRSGVALLPAEVDAGAPITATYVQATDECIILSGGSPIAGMSADIYARIIPVGTPIPWPTEIVPAGFLPLSGQAVSRTNYAELFAVYGTRYGAGNGTTTFNLPRYNDGSFIRGWDLIGASDLDAASRTNRGDGTTGNNVGTRQADATRQHQHAASLTVAASGATSTAGSHAHTMPYDLQTLGGTGANGLRPGGAGSATNAAGDHTHTVSVSGSATGNTELSGGTETRPSNISVYWITLALPGAASAGTLGVGGLSYRYESATADAAPLAGYLRLSNAAPHLATSLYISETDAYSASLATMLQSIPANSMLYLYKVGAPGTFTSYVTVAAPVDAGSYKRFSGLIHVGSNGAFTAGDELVIVVMRAGAAGVGSPGVAGSDGGIRWSFASSTTMGDPGAGSLRFNSATMASVTAIAMSVSSAEPGNPSMAAWVNGWDDSTSSVKGQIIIRDLTDTTKQAVFDVTGAVVDNGSWLQVPVSFLSGAGTPAAADSLALSFSPSGDRGTDGIGTGTVTGITFERGIYGGAVAVSGAAGIEVPIMPGGRLSLVSNTPVMTSNATGQSTVYWTPDKHLWCPIYNGTRWEMHNLGGELSQTTTDTTKSPAACVANAIYDLYVWNDSGTYRISRGFPWASGSTRGTGVGTAERQRTLGLWTNAQNITNGPAAGRGLYVGSIRTNSSALIDWRYGGTAAGGTSGLFSVYNAFNQRRLASMSQDSTDSWAYAGTSIRRSNNATGMSTSVLQDEGNDTVEASFASLISSTAVTIGLIGIGVGSTAAFSGDPAYGTSGAISKPVARWAGVWTGWREVCALEVCSAASTATFYGDASDPTRFANALIVSAMI